MISEKQIKFSSNLQDETTEKSHIQSIQVEEIVKVADDHRQQLVFFIFSHRPPAVLGPPSPRARDPSAPPLPDGGGR